MRNIKRLISVAVVAILLVTAAPVVFAQDNGTSTDPVVGTSTDPVVGTSTDPVVDPDAPDVAPPPPAVDMPQLDEGELSEKNLKLKRKADRIFERARKKAQRTLDRAEKRIERTLARAAKKSEAALERAQKKVDRIRAKAEKKTMRSLERAQKKLDRAYKRIVKKANRNKAKADRKAKPPAAEAPKPKLYRINLLNIAFETEELSVKVGDSINWVNEDNVPHTVTSDDGTTFQSETLTIGDVFNHTFTEAGTFTYHCNFHPNMTATVVVIH